MWNFFLLFYIVSSSLFVFDFFSYQMMYTNIQNYKFTIKMKIKILLQNQAIQKLNLRCIVNKYDIKYKE